MKINYIYYHNRNFFPIHVDEIITELKKRGYEIHLFTSIKNREVKKRIYDNGIRLHNLWTTEIRFISEFIFMALLLPYLLVESYFFKPDVFYTRHSACSLIPLLIAKLFKKPCLIEINDIIQDKFKFANISKAKKIWVKLYHFINYRLADYLLPVTDKIGEWIIDNYPVRHDQVVVCTNGVNVNRYSPKPKCEARKRYKINENAKVILSLGSLFPWSGIEVLIESAPKILNVFPETLFVIGSGEEPYLSNLKKIAEKNKVKGHFLFYGFVPWDEAAWFISAADVCVFPYTLNADRTGLSSLRVFAYLSCGVPVIASDVRGLGDMLKNHEIGVSVGIKNSNELAKAIITLMADQNLRQKMGKKGREFVIQNFSWTLIVDKIERLFRASIP